MLQYPSKIFLMLSSPTFAKQSFDTHISGLKHLPPGVVLTSDGSYTLRHPQYDAMYHSIHGALQESMHVFIEAGLLPLLDRPSLRIFEFGFGTGLNLMLTARSLEGSDVSADYHAIDVSPPSIELLTTLNFPDLLDRPEYKELNNIIAHPPPAGSSFDVGPMRVMLHKVSLQDSRLQGPYDLVYFDAFGPGVQPELWTLSSLEKIAANMSPGGVLVTYCAQGQFKRNLKALGFHVESIPGPPGKREMVRATFTHGSSL